MDWEGGVAKANLRTINGKPAYQAVRVITVKQFATDPHTGNQVIVKTKKRLTGTGQTRTEAESRLEEKVLDFRLLMRQDPNNPDLRPKKKQDSITLNALLDIWLTYKEVGDRHPVDQATLNEYRTRCDTHIRPDLGERRIRSITRQDLDTYIWETLPARKKWEKNPDTGELEETDKAAVGQSLRRGIYTVLKQSLDLAVQREMLTFNPIVGVKRPAQQRMSDEAEARIIAHHYIPRRVVKGLWGDPELGRWILMFMGLRASERLGIEIGSEGSLRYLEDADKPTELIVNRQIDVNRKTREWFIKYKTKTRSGKRILILPEEVSQHLLLWKQQRDKWEKEARKNGSWEPEEGLENLLFVQPNGRAIRPQKDRYAWARLLKSLKLPHHREHNMRHMTATMLGKSGVNPNTARVILGHSDVLMTFFYQHYSKADTAEPLAEIAGQFSKDVSTTTVAEITVRDDGTAEPIETLDATHDIGKVLLMGDEEEDIA